MVCVFWVGGIRLDICCHVCSLRFLKGSLSRSTFQERVIISPSDDCVGFWVL